MRKKSTKPKAYLFQRRVTYRLYPTKAQEEILWAWLKLHAELYNAAIEERRTAYKTAGVSIGYVSQQNQLPEIKEIRPELVPLGSNALQSTCARVDLAYAAFFRRLKAGETPGYPRFKSWRRFKGWTWPSKSGWKLETKENSRKATLHIPTLGDIRARGLPRQTGVPATLTITRKRGIWEASVVLNISKADREHGEERLAFDWGLETFLTMSDGSTVDNPRLLKKQLKVLKKAQKDLDRKKRGSNNRDKAKEVVTKLYRDVTNARKDFLHKESAILIARSGFLATETLDTESMVESEHASCDLRRSILDGSPAAFNSMVRYKAEEAGTALSEIETREAKPSQRCPECFALCGKKPLSQRTHRCPHCGHAEGRDLAAARVILQWAEGRRPPGGGPAEIAEETAPVRRETPCLARSASMR